jgi:hypothetical protein
LIKDKNTFAFVKFILKHFALGQLEQEEAQLSFIDDPSAKVILGSQLLSLARLSQLLYLSAQFKALYSCQSNFSNQIKDLMIILLNVLKTTFARLTAYRLNIQVVTQICDMLAARFSLAQ